jgi:hypothetical protein
MIRLAHREETMSVYDHIRSGNDHIVRTATRADGSGAIVPEVGNICVGEEAVAVGTATGRIGSFSLAGHH